MAIRRGLFVRIALAGAFVLALVGYFVFVAVVGETTWVFDDSPSPATVSEGNTQIAIAPGQWGGIRLPDNQPHLVTVALADGTMTRFPVDLRHRPNFPNARAYATTGRGCFALLDVSAVYRSTTATTVTPVAVFTGTQVMERQIPWATVLDPGPLPRETTWNRSYPTILWYSPVDCATASNPATLAAWSQQLLAR